MNFPSNSPASSPILDMPEGRPLRVTELKGDSALRSKLYALGLLPGTPVEVCSRGCGNGSMCLRVRHCSLVIGEGLARAIYCVPLEGRGFGQGSRCGQARHCPGEGPACPRPEGADLLAAKICSPGHVAESNGRSG